MGRPGEKITRKTIMMQNKMKELDLKERSSKSLLANVLDMDDDFRYFIIGSFYRTFYRVQTYTKHYQDYNHKILTILLNKINFFFNHNQCTDKNIFDDSYWLVSHFLDFLLWKNRIVYFK